MVSEDAATARRAAERAEQELVRARDAAAVVEHALRSELAAARHNASQARQEAEHARRHADELRHDLDQVRSEAKVMETTLRAQVAAARHERDQARMAIDRARSEAAEARGEAVAAADNLKAQLAAARGAAEQACWEASYVREEASETCHAAKQSFAQQAAESSNAAALLEAQSRHACLELEVRCRDAGDRAGKFQETLEEALAREARFKQEGSQQLHDMECALSNAHATLAQKDASCSLMSHEIGRLDEALQAAREALHQETRVCEDARSETVSNAAAARAAMQQQREEHWKALEASLKTAAACRLEADQARLESAHVQEEATEIRCKAAEEARVQASTATAAAASSEEARAFAARQEAASKHTFDNLEAICRETASRKVAVLDELRAESARFREVQAEAATKLSDCQAELCAAQREYVREADVTASKSALAACAQKENQQLFGYLTNFQRRTYDLERHASFENVSPQYFSAHALDIDKATRCRKRTTHSGTDLEKTRLRTEKLCDLLWRFFKKAHGPLSAVRAQCLRMAEAAKETMEAPVVYVRGSEDLPGNVMTLLSLLRYFERVMMRCSNHSGSASTEADDTEDEQDMFREALLSVMSLQSLRP